jgi:hypothetical protein
MKQGRLSSLLRFRIPAAFLGLIFSVFLIATDLSAAGSDLNAAVHLDDGVGLAVTKTFPQSHIVGPFIGLVAAVTITQVLYRRRMAQLQALAAIDR